MLKKDLEYLGLTDKEASVYLAALELGKSPAQKIAQKSGVNRATTYVIIETLSKKGLMSNYTEDKKQFFCAEAPEKLNLLFREETMAIQRRQEYLSKILPELKSLNASVKSKPVVRYYEGKAGLRAMSEEFFIFEHKEPAKMIYSVDLLSNVFSNEEIQKIRERRQAKKINIKAIVNDKKEKLKTDAEFYRVDFNKYPFTSDIAFFGDKVRIATQKGDLLGLIIENKEISNTFKTLFNMAFEYIKILNKKNRDRKQ
jgi:sugar-specific transcriptional regulator TrmB